VKELQRIPRRFLDAIEDYDWCVRSRLFAATPEAWRDFLAGYTESTPGIGNTDADLIALSFGTRWLTSSKVGEIVCSPASHH
jgi:hypothetical protein